MRGPLLRIHADELIVDGFAGGGGTSLGIEQALGRSPDIALNHDPEALAMHEVMARAIVEANFEQAVVSTRQMTLRVG